MAPTIEKAARTDAGLASQLRLSVTVSYTHLTLPTN